LTPEKDYNPAVKPPSIYQRMEPCDSNADSLKSDIFDALAVFERVNHDMELLRDLVELFCHQYPELLRSIDRAIGQHAFLDVEKLSHKLKGSLLQFSARKAVLSARRLEEMGKRKTLEGAIEESAQLGIEVNLLAQALHTILDAGSPAISVNE
jgi:HPt (histidine-containing phosphotransfer) domain-containing protein